MPNGNYSSTRYSTLSQINKDNVGDLQAAWTFSTGVLRGHEGGPLVIGDVMYIVTPFPNIVYALDLNDDGRVIWKYEPKQDPSVIAGDVLRHGQPRRRLRRRQDRVRPGRLRPSWRWTPPPARSLWQVKNADPAKGEVMTSAPLIYKDKVYVGRLRRRVGRPWLPGRVQPERRQAGLEAASRPAPTT